MARCGTILQYAKEKMISEYSFKLLYKKEAPVRNCIFNNSLVSQLSHELQSKFRQMILSSECE